MNLDRLPPRDGTQHSNWRPGDLQDKVSLTEAFREFQPTHVVHLGARTDLGGTSLDDYRDNTSGTRNLLDVMESTATVEMFVNTSTLLVCKNGYTPLSDTDYCPATPYGLSKQVAEEMVRDWAGAPWVIARPTSIWGSWFEAPYRRFFESVMAGRYVHPGRDRVVKAFGYVGNTVVQLERLLDSPAGETHYLCDQESYTIDAFATTVAEVAGVRDPRRVPLPALRVAAAIGTALQRTKLISDPPITSFRLQNMLTESSYDSTEIDDLTGELPFDMRAGVEKTVAWLADAAT